MVATTILETYKYPFYLGTAIILYTTYLLMGFGIYMINPAYLNILIDIFHIIVCLFLMVRFNPFQRYVFRPYDNNIVFGTALLLLFNVLIFDLGINFQDMLDRIQNKVLPRGRLDTST